MVKGMQKTDVVDYRSVNLAWLISFKERVFRKELAPEIQLVVALEDTGLGGSFEVHKGDTLCITAIESSSSFSVSRPFGDVRTGVVPRSAVEAKPREEWSTDDVAEYVVKRACEEDQCTYLGLVEKPRKNVSKKDYKGAFISHARRCRFAELVESLEVFFTLKKKNIERQYVWLDIFCVNQPKLAAYNMAPVMQNECEHHLTEGLHMAITHFEQHVVFMDKWDVATPLSRAWCVWEIFGVAKAKKQIEIALPASEFERFIVALTTDYDSIVMKTSELRVERARCSYQMDLALIHKAIREQSSFLELDAMIITQLRLWIASTGKLLLEKEETMANPDLHRAMLLASQAGKTYQEREDYGNAELLLRKALRIAERVSQDRAKDAVLATQLSNLATLLNQQGNPKEASQLYGQAVAINKKLHGTKSLEFAQAIDNLAVLAAEQKKVSFAKALKRKVLAIRQERLGSKHVDVAQTLIDLAQLLCITREYIEAEKLIREGMAIRRKLLGEEYPSLAGDLIELAVTLMGQAKYDEAVELTEEALARDTKDYGAGHPITISSLALLGKLWRCQGLLAKAETARRAVAELRRKVQGETNPEFASALEELGQVLSTQGKSDEAIAIFEQAVNTRRTVFGRNHVSVAKVCWLLAASLKEVGKMADAKSNWKMACQIFKTTYGDKDSAYLECLGWWKDR